MGKSPQVSVIPVSHFVIGFLFVIPVFPFVIPAKAGIHGHSNVSHKSFHSGLSFSIRLIFQARFHFLICFSRAMAEIMLEWCSK